MGRRIRPGEPSLGKGSEAAPVAAQRTTRSALYAVSGSGGGALLALIRSVVVARILAPTEFGRFVLVATILGVIDIASQPGLEAAAVQQRKLEARTLETLWSTLILRALLLALVVFVVADPLAEWFGAESSADLLRAVAFVPVVRSFGSLSVLARAHSVDLAPQARLQLAGQATETVVSIAACAMTRSASGLVVGLLAGAFVEMAASWRVPGFRPRVRLVIGELLPLVRFGRWVFASNILGFLSTNGDDLVVGRFLGPGPLGLYRVAYRLANLPTVQLSHAFGRVAFPALSRLQDAHQTVRNDAFLRYLRLTASTAGLIAAVLVATADDLVLVLLGDAWEGASTPLSIMAAAGFVRALVATGGPFFMAAAIPQFDTMMQVIRVVVLASGIALLIVPFGISGVATASLLSVLAIIPIWLLGLRRFGLRPQRVLAEVATALPAAVISGLTGLLISRSLGQPLPAVLLATISAIASWLLLVWLLQPSLRREMLLVFGHLSRNRWTDVG